MKTLSKLYPTKDHSQLSAEVSVYNSGIESFSPSKSCISPISVDATYLLCFTVGVTAVVDEARRVPFACGIYDLIWVESHEVVMRLVFSGIPFAASSELLVIQNLSAIFHQENAARKANTNTLLQHIGFCRFTFVFLHKVTWISYCLKQLGTKIFTKCIKLFFQLRHFGFPTINQKVYRNSYLFNDQIYIFYLH